MARLIHAIIIYWATLAVAREAKQQPATDPVLNTYTSQGCFSKLPAGAEPRKRKTLFLTSGSCAEYCKEANKYVAVTGPDGCHCADTYPAKSALVKDAQCNLPCSGYAPEACGGEDPVAYSVWNTGILMAVGNDDDDDSPTRKPGATTTISSITPPSTPLPSKLPTTADVSSAAESITAEGTTAEDTTAVNTPTQGTTTADSTDDAQSTPSSTATDVPNAAAPRLSSPVGKLVRMFKVFFN